jgi:hypothetical protein
MKQFSILMFLLTSLTGFGQPDTYSYKRKLNKTEKEDYYSVSLSPEITAHCKSGLNDLRLYNFNDDDTIEIPYLLNYLGDKSEEKPIQFKLINDVTNLKCCSFVTLKMEKKEIINRIKLDVEENNFDKIIVLEGSNDNKEWFTIKNHLRITGIQNSSADFKTTELDFPDTEYNYFRLKFDDDGSNKIAVTNAYAFKNVIEKGKYQKLGIASQHQTENKKEKTSSIIIELPMNYLVSFITLQSKGGNDFYRDFTVYSSSGTFHTQKGEEESWEMISSGVIESRQENKVSFGNIQTKKIKIEIINYDDQPITLDQVNVFSENITMTAKLPSSENTYLTYGKEFDTAPVYDLMHFREKIPNAIPDIVYGNEEIKNNVSIAKAGPLLKSKSWLWGIMISVILLIGYFAMSMLKKEKG